MAQLQSFVHHIQSIYSPFIKRRQSISHVRVRDKHATLLRAMAVEPNQVWNYCNELSDRMIRERVKWLSWFRKRGDSQVSIHTALSPACTTDWLSEKGRAALTQFGIVPPQTTGTPTHCPHCQSSDVEKICQFGSTPCKAHPDI